MEKQLYNPNRTFIRKHTVKAVNNLFPVMYNWQVSKYLGNIIKNYLHQTFLLENELTWSCAIQWPFTGLIQSLFYIYILFNIHRVDSSAKHNLTVQCLLLLNKKICLFICLLLLLFIILKKIQLTFKTLFYP